MKKLKLLILGILFLAVSPVAADRSSSSSKGGRNWCRLDQDPATGCNLTPMDPRNI